MRPPPPARRVSHRGSAVLRLATVASLVAAAVGGALWLLEGPPWGPPHGPGVEGDGTGGGESPAAVPGGRGDAHPSRPSGTLPAPTAREGLATEGEAFLSGELPADPMARFFVLGRQSAPGPLEISGRELVDALLAPGWTYVRYADPATRDELLAATFHVQGLPNPERPESVSAQMMDLLKAAQARKLRVRLQGPVFEVSRLLPK